MKDVIKKYYYIILCVVIILGMFIIPSLIYSFLNKIISNDNLNEILSNIIYLISVFLLYYKDLKKEFKLFYKNIKNNISSGFKWYFVSIIIMIISNLIIMHFFGEISDNETLVREYILKYPIYAFISVAIIAPILEELVFRKSIMKCTNNKIVGVVLCGLTFGLAHIISYVTSFSYLVYLIPYASLGVGFSIMDYENKNTFVSMFYHSFHNIFSFVIIIISYNIGVL